MLVISLVSGFREIIMITPVDPGLPKRLPGAVSHMQTRKQFEVFAFFSFRHPSCAWLSECQDDPSTTLYHIFTVN